MFNGSGLPLKVGNFLYGKRMLVLCSNIVNLVYWEKKKKGIQIGDYEKL